jgi:SHS2 domain-containing protein
VTRELREHRGEVKLRLRAPTLGDLAAEAGRALAEIALGPALPAASGAARRLRVCARDRGALLVAWLNELVYLADAEGWVAVEFTPIRATDTELLMMTGGVSVTEPPALVKAATLHGLHVAEEGSGFVAEVVLDV